MKTMKKSFLVLTLIISLICLQCKDRASSDCNENIEFKDVFMSKINSVEEYSLGKGDRKSFDESLEFLSKYVKVSFEEIMNYANEYTNIDAFKKDKSTWLEWYEKNKCDNIQFK
ncbi:hypothetical protein [uncultured Psychroserpens sp.]|uniref:hypothetical protein n=1 Tax=uncultured Psychroserpens sp. TaxID=255436 RepID=UPI002628396C|nr:hypothetical protein [uncultured Psychroserpens sp.]